MIRRLIRLLRLKHISRSTNITLDTDFSKDQKGFIISQSNCLYNCSKNVEAPDLNTNIARSW